MAKKSRGSNQNRPESLIEFTEKQQDMIFTNGTVNEIFWGGQAGGGKSEGLLRFSALRRLMLPGSVGICFRRTFPELEKSLIRKSHTLYPKLGAKWSESKKWWVFPNGSIQEFGYIAHENDVTMYQSAEYDDICFDELTHFSERQYLYMRSRLRPRGNGKWSGLIRSASNPGGVGHLWVKAYFVDRAKNKVHIETDARGRKRSRLFMPATLEDNTKMTKYERDEYEAWLEGLPEAERKMLMYGDWDFIPDAAFGEYDPNKHIYHGAWQPMQGSHVIMGFDYGYAKPFSCGWYVADYDGRLRRFKEWYGWSGLKADDGIRVPPSDIAKGIKTKEKAWGLDQCTIERIADPSIFSKSVNLRGGGQGPSVADIMSEHGIDFIPGDNDRLLGKQQVHERLKVPEDGELPMLLIHEDCNQFLRTFPALRNDDTNIEDVDTKGEDHSYDELKYVLMSRPITPERDKPKASVCEAIISDVMNPKPPTDELVEIYDY